MDSSRPPRWLPQSGPRESGSAGCFCSMLLRPLITLSSSVHWANSTQLQKGHTVSEELDKSQTSRWENGTPEDFSYYQRIHSWVWCDFINNELPWLMKITSVPILPSQGKKITAKHTRHGFEGTACITYNAKVSSPIKTHRTFYTEGMATTGF